MIERRLNGGWRWLLAWAVALAVSLGPPQSAQAAGPPFRVVIDADHVEAGRVLIRPAG